MTNGELTCVFWDVQHGSAAYINTPAGEHIVIDLGVGSYQGSSLQFSPLLHLKNRYGVRQLDAVVITHPHRDHLDDIGNFDELSPRILLRPKHLVPRTCVAATVPRTGRSSTNTSLSTLATTSP